MVHVVCLVTVDIHYSFSPTRKTLTQILTAAIFKWSPIRSPAFLDCLWLFMQQLFSQLSPIHAHPAPPTNVMTRNASSCPLAQMAPRTISSRSEVYSWWTCHELGTVQSQPQLLSQERPSSEDDWVVASTAECGCWDLLVLPQSRLLYNHPSASAVDELILQGVVAPTADRWFQTRALPG